MQISLEQNTVCLRDTFHLSELLERKKKTDIQKLIFAQARSILNQVKGFSLKLKKLFFFFFSLLLLFFCLLIILLFEIIFHLFIMFSIKVE